MNWFDSWWNYDTSSSQKSYEISNKKIKINPQTENKDNNWAHIKDKFNLVSEDKVKYAEDISQFIQINPSTSENKEIFTENNALSYHSKNTYLNLFYKATRDSDQTFLWENIESILSDNPVKAGKLMFYIRDRTAKGQRFPFFVFYRYLIAHSNKNDCPIYHRFIVNSMEHIAEYGYWKDLLNIFSNTKYEHTMINIYCRQLRLDEFEKEYLRPISLAAKYMPAEGHHFDKKYKLSFKFQKELALKSKKEYRIYRSKFLKYLNVVEQNLCAQDWENIDFEKIP